MHETHFQSQFTAAALLEYLLHWLQRWSKTPWITEHTQWITVGARAIFACAATVGISWKYEGGTLVIAGLGAATLLPGIWHLISQYAMQHAFGGLVRSGNLDKIKEIVKDAVEIAVANRATQSANSTQ